MERMAVSVPFLSMSSRSSSKISHRVRYRARRHRVRPRTSAASPASAALGVFARELEIGGRREMVMDVDPARIAPVLCQRLSPRE